MTHPDIYSALKRDHQRLVELFQQLAEAPGQGTPARHRLHHQLAQALKVHTEAEDSTFYAALDRHPPARDRVAQAREDHQRLVELLNALSALESDHQHWEQRLTELKETVQIHLHEEENELFPLAQQWLSGQEAEALGQRFREEKQKVRP